MKWCDKILDTRLWPTTNCTLAMYGSEQLGPHMDVFSGWWKMEHWVLTKIVWYACWLAIAGVKRRTIRRRRRRTIRPAVVAGTWLNPHIWTWLNKSQKKNKTTGNRWSGENKSYLVCLCGIWLTHKHAVSLLNDVRESDREGQCESTV